MKRAALLAVAVIGVLVLIAPHRAAARPSPRRTVSLTRVPNIVGGVSAVGSSLGMVAEVVYNDGTGNGFLCSGTVVSSDVILTAGHCAVDTDSGLTNPAGGYEVLTGTQSDDSPGQISGVSRVIPYPTFDPSTLSGDAALLVLTAPTTVAPVALASDPTDGYLYDGGDATVIAGWGADDDNGDLPGELLYGFDVVQNDGYCGQQISDVNASFNPASQLCAVDASSYAEGTCHGDSGGPMLAYAGGWVEIGITSFGPDDCNAALPAVFTRIDAINSWIENEIAENPPPTPAPSSAPAPASAPSPSPTPLLPKAGSYRGRTAQGKNVRARIESGERTLTDIRFGYVLRCTRHRNMTFSLTTPEHARATSRDSLRFSTDFRDPEGRRYRFAGQFSPGGSAFGTLSVEWRTRQYGLCRSGRINWHAAI